MMIQDRACRLASLKRHGRAIALLAMLAMIPIAMSCYGRFPLTRYIYRVNGEVGTSADTQDSTQTRLVQSVVMWVFIIIPVYGVSMLADAIIFNMVEFWTKEPVEIGGLKAPDGSEVAIKPNGDGRSATMTVTRDGQLVETKQLIRVSDQKLEIRTADGQLSGMMLRGENGKINLADAQGRVLSTVDAPAS